jgi:tetratricopeptide (TPR) repeat protein
MLLNRFLHSLKSITTSMVIFFMIVALPTYAQETGMSPESEDLFSLGVEAAKLEEWDTALSFFKEARIVDPLSPRTVFNIALAYDRSGREILAMAWYRFYLALAPSVDNTRQVLDRFPALEEATRAKIQKLKQFARNAIEIVPDPDDRTKYCAAYAKTQAISGDPEEAHEVYFGDKKYGYFEGQRVLGAIGASHALAGDFERAVQFSETINYPDQKAVVFRMMAETQAAFGDIEEARKTIDMIGQEGQVYDWKGQKDEALLFLSRVQALRGDITGARQTTGMIAENWKKDSSYSFITQTQIKQGDVAAAISAGKSHAISYLLKKGNFDRAIEIADRMSSYGEPDTNSKIQVYIWIAGAQIEGGYQSEALNMIQKTLELAQSRKWTRNDFQDTQYYVYRAIIVTQAEAGDVSGIMKTAKLPEPYVHDKLGIGRDIARALAVAGDEKKAYKAASKVSKDEYKVEAYINIAEVMAKKGNIKKAKKAVKSAKNILRGMKKKDYAAAYVAKGYALTGNYDEAFRLAETIEEDFEINLAYKAIGKAQVKNGDVEDAWQTAVMERAKGARDNIFDAIVKYYVEQGDLNKAISSAFHLSNISMEGLSWSRMAETTIKNGQIDYWTPRIFGEAVLGVSGEIFLSDTHMGGYNDSFLADAVIRSTIYNETEHAKNMALVIENDWIRSWALYWAALAQARVGDAEGVKETLALIPEEKYRSLALEESEERLKLVTEDPENKKVLLWSDRVLYLGSKTYLSHFRKTVDMLETEDINMNLHYLGAISGNMTTWLDLVENK